MKRLLPGLAACLIPIFCGAQEKPPEDWAKELGSEDPAIPTKNGDTEGIKSARAAVEGFWRIRLLEIPASGTYRHWQKEWASLFP